jgi:hypothetical protein
VSGPHSGEHGRPDDPLALATRVVRDAGIAHRPVHVQALEGGYSHAVYDIDGRFILRASPEGERSAGLAREAATLARLHGMAGVPDLLGHDVIETGQRLRYVLLARLPGDNLFRLWPGLSAPEREAAVREIVRIMRPVHALPVSGYTIGYHQTACLIGPAPGRQATTPIWPRCLHGCAPPPSIRRPTRS